MTLRGFLSLLVAGACALPLAASAKDPKGSPKFKTSYRAALSEAKKQNKPVILIFSASWCGPCQKMKKEVYPSAEVQPWHDKFVWAYLDTDDASNRKAAEKYGVRGIPHIEFVNAEGESIDKQVGSSPAEAFAKTLEAIHTKATGKDKEAAKGEEGESRDS